VQDGQELLWLSLFWGIAKDFGEGVQWNHCCPFLFILTFTRTLGTSLPVFHFWSDPWYHACFRDSQNSSASNIFQVLRSPQDYLIALTFAILLGKAALRAKYPESICSWFSFSKNRIQSSRPLAGWERSGCSRPFTTTRWPLPQPLSSQHCFLLKRPRPYRISDGGNF
jgi:hypothetical protein